MEKITYFGTQRRPGHYPLGINYYMEQYDIDFYNSCDSERFMIFMYNHFNKEHKAAYFLLKNLTVYGILYSVDDDRASCETVLFWEGKHTIEEMEKLIEDNEFLHRQFDVKNRMHEYKRTV
jgi:hypothetical protein